MGRHHVSLCGSGTATFTRPTQQLRSWLPVFWSHHRASQWVLHIRHAVCRLHAGALGLAVLLAPPAFDVTHFPFKVKKVIHQGEIVIRNNHLQSQNLSLTHLESQTIPIQPTPRPRAYLYELKAIKKWTTVKSALKYSLFVFTAGCSVTYWKPFSGSLTSFNWDGTDGG